MAIPRILSFGIGLSGILLAGSTGYGVSQSLNWNLELIQSRNLAEFVGPVLPDDRQNRVQENQDVALNEEAPLIGAPGMECLGFEGQYLPACAIWPEGVANPVREIEIVATIPETPVTIIPVPQVFEADDRTLAVARVGDPAPRLDRNETDQADQMQDAETVLADQTPDTETVLVDPQQDAEIVAADALPPTPAPISHRPVLVVYPANAQLIRIARTVSGDPLVHEQAPGSWPRRLDQVNALAGAEQIILAQSRGSNIFLRNWVETRKGIRLAGFSR